MYLVSKQFNPDAAKPVGRKQSFLATDYAGAMISHGTHLLKNVTEDGLSYETMWDIYRTNPWVRAIIDKIENRVTQVDIKIEKIDLGNDAGAAQKEQDAHIKEVESLLADPNDLTESFYKIRKKIVKDLLLYDSASIEIVKGKTADGKKIPALLYGVAGDEIKLNIDDKGLFKNISKAYLQVKRRQVVADWGLYDMAYFVKNPRSGNPYGLAALDSLVMPVSGDYASDTYNLDFFSNNARPNIAFLFENMGFGKGQAGLNRAKAWYLENHQRQPHLPLFMGTEKGEIKLMPLTMTNKDMEHKEYGKSNLEKVMAVFGMQPFIMGIVTETTGKLNSEEQAAQFKIDAVVPYLKVFEEGFNNVVIWSQQNFGYRDIFMTHDSLDIRDEEKVAEQRERYLKNAVITINEVRNQMGLMRVDWGDVPYIPVNLAPFGGQIPTDENDKGKKYNLDSQTMIDMLVGNSRPTGLEYVSKQKVTDAVTAIIREREKELNKLHSFSHNIGVAVSDRSK